MAPDLGRAGRMPVSSGGLRPQLTSTTISPLVLVFSCGCTRAERSPSSTPIHPQSIPTDLLNCCKADLVLEFYACVVSQAYLGMRETDPPRSPISRVDFSGIISPISCWCRHTLARCRVSVGGVNRLYQVKAAATSHERHGYRPMT